MYARLIDWGRFGLCSVVVNEGVSRDTVLCLCCPSHGQKVMVNSVDRILSTQSFV